MRESSIYQDIFAEGFEIGFQESFEIDFQEGFEIGFKEGFEIGFKEGLEEGRQETIAKIARNLLLTGMSVEQIITVTGLTRERIEQLTNRDSE
ncbi:hypothetical protein [Oscillatoria sp. HE19RPO]|uniref:hypothetical protein n=1 Tax=Oscillatoria sp. HE19RPO TaxID=2954806 RepID=UPI0020C34484|nr:hypothetical protein [Oscillatoria sp. HE19RPO]